MCIISAHKFAEIANYTFKDNSLLSLAFTHSSYANEYKSNPSTKSQQNDKPTSNERLEFLGDAVLELVVSQYLYTNFPNLTEGELSKLRASIVCESTLSGKASQLNFGSYLILGKGEEYSGGRNRESTLADTFEAVIGAIFIDGGIESATAYILFHMEKDIVSLKNIFKTVDNKTTLQEIIQKTSKEPIEYVIISESGPDHDKSFIAEVHHCGKVLGRGSGKNKKEAEQIAASAALDLIK